MTIEAADDPVAAEVALAELLATSTHEELEHAVLQLILVAAGYILETGRWPAKAASVIEGAFNPTVVPVVRAIAKSYLPTNQAPTITRH